MFLKHRRTKVADRVHAHLFDLGFTDIYIKSNLGYWSHEHQDVCRWEGRAVRLSDMRKVFLFSWDKMAECAVRGVTIEEEVDRFGRIWVSAKPAKSSP